MRIIQPLLVLALLAAFVIYLRQLRSRLRDRMLVGMGLGASIYLVLVPEASTRLAALLGVGRGVDVIIYLAIAMLGLVCVLLVSKIMQVQNQVVRLCREIAILEAREPAAPLEG